MVVETIIYGGIALIGFSILLNLTFRWVIKETSEDVREENE